MDSWLITSAVIKVWKFQTSDLCSDLGEMPQRRSSLHPAPDCFMCRKPEGSQSNTAELGVICKSTAELYICPSQCLSPLLSLVLFRQYLSSGTESGSHCQAVTSELHLSLCQSCISALGQIMALCLIHCSHPDLFCCGSYSLSQSVASMIRLFLAASLLISGKLLLKYFVDLCIFRKVMLLSLDSVFDSLN